MDAPARTVTSACSHYCMYLAPAESESSRTSGVDKDLSYLESGESLFYFKEREVETYESLADATKKELEWCLAQLENIQTKRPVSDMATTKVSAPLVHVLTAKFHLPPPLAF
ncbi:hypothetical protein ACTXT7_005715 [Hymenolepis weldensis]